MSETKTRRAALAALASVPALAILPAMAVASPTSTVQLDELIAAYDAAFVVIQNADDVVDELTDMDPSFSFLGLETPTFGRGAPGREKLTRDADLFFRVEATRIESISLWSPELGEAARAMLETKKAESLAQIEAAYADYDAAEKAVTEAEKACAKALEAVCAHRCASPDELTIKVRWIANTSCPLEPEQCAAFFRSLLPEGEDVAVL
jgi:hypothetical protein